MSTTRKNTRTLLIISIIAIVGILALTVALSSTRFNFIPQLVSSKINPEKSLSFPEIDESKLTTNQNRAVSILKQEYSSQPDGTKYSEGVQEPWCADFISWVFNEAGVPLSNPNSGSWRIPGTFTLREYYENEDRFKPANSGYEPKIGDIVLYDNPSPFGQHTNIVIDNENGTVTTIGGNEPGGIRIVKHKPADDKGFLGYGVFRS